VVPATYRPGDRGTRTTGIGNSNRAVSVIEDLNVVISGLGAENGENEAEFLPSNARDLKRHVFVVRITAGAVLVGTKPLVFIGGCLVLSSKGLDREGGHEQEYGY
jgi:hypothetical protein